MTQYRYLVIFTTRFTRGLLAGVETEGTVRFTDREEAERWIRDVKGKKRKGQEVTTARVEEIQS